jgi:sugar diacid utilization regulator
MRISYSIILEILSPYCPKPQGPKPETAGIEWVEYFSPDVGFESENTLYVASRSAIRDVPVPDGTICILTKSKGDSAFKMKDHGNVILLNRETSPYEIITLIRDTILKFHDWEINMLDCVMRKDLQELLAYSGRIIGNTLLIFNSDFRLIAYSKDIPCNDSFFRTLIQNNTSPNNSASQFAQMDEFTTVFPNPSNDTNVKERAHDVPIVNKTIRLGDLPRIHVCMLCNNRPATAGCIEMFDILAKNLSLFMEREAPIGNSQSSINPFVIDLLENRIHDAIAIDNRAEFCKIPNQKLYSLFVVNFTKNTSNDYLHALKTLAEVLPDAFVVPYNNSLIVICYFKSCEMRLETNAWIKTIIEAIGDTHTEIGVGTPEPMIHNLRIAYIRATTAIEYGKRVQDRKEIFLPDRSDINLHQQHRVYLYETYYIYHIINYISAENKTIFDTSFCLRGLAKLRAYDKATGMDNLKLLYCHLQYERSVSKTAAQLHMHRNNVIYRINRIEDLLNVHLNEHDFRFKFLFIYRILDYYGLDYLDTIDYKTVMGDIPQRHRQQQPKTTTAALPETSADKQ